MVKKLFRRLEDTWVAITFAEAGEFDKARQIITEEKAVEQKRPTARKIIRERLRHVR